MLKKPFLLYLGLGLLTGFAQLGAADPEPAPTPAAPVPPAGRPLRYILISDSVEEAQKLMPAADSGFVVLGQAFSSFNAAELTKRLAAGENRPIEERLLAAIAQVIENFFRQNDYPTAAALVPTQSIATGQVRILVTLGEKSKSPPVVASTEWKIRNINMTGARWFSESLLREKLRIERGGIVRFSELDNAISWTNSNPFRRVRVHLDPVPNTGEADLSIAVQDAFPLRLSASFDNSGNEILGENHYTAAVSYGNMWGKDHQLSYQYITTSLPKYYQGHGLDYRVPLPWRHHLQFSASYVKASPALYDGLIILNGETITSDLRYTLPLRTGNNPAELFAALTFKESNNNLDFGGVTVSPTKTDIFQFTSGISTVYRDKRGAWAFGASITLSPGGINSRNTDTAFDGFRHGGEDSARLGARASYYYGGITVQRLLTLAPGWDLMSRGVAQASQANLLASEQLSIGGATTVRGFRENVFSGDHGFLISNDLMAPPLKKNLPYISKTRGPLETRFLAFFDAGNTAARHRYPSDPHRVALMSAGVGVRMSLSTNFSLNADYGWQISHLPTPVEDHSRGHVRATLAF